MQSLGASCRFRAQWLVPVAGPPLADGLVAVRAGRIAALAGRRGHQAVRRGALAALDEGPLVDLGAVALLPGLVNPHTHLEFSHSAAPLGEPGLRFPAWIRQVIAARQTEPPAGDPIARGLVESLTAGVVHVGDIDQVGSDPTSSRSDEVSERRPGCTRFLELRGFSPARRAAALDAARAFLAAPLAPGQGERRGLSPHAPYSVHPETLSQSVTLARQYRRPMAMHLAESPEELELIAERRGAFRELLVDLGLWSAAEFLPTMLDYLRVLGQAPRALVIHGNFLTEPELAYLAQERHKLSVVYCPRTHAYFGHPRHPLPGMLTAGVRVAVGTDSRASNPDLDLWAELRHVARDFPELRPRQVLALGSLEAARALGISREWGSLAPGRRADLVAFPLEERAGDPEAALLEGALGPRRVFLGGQALPEPPSTGPSAD